MGLLLLLALALATAGCSGQNAATASAAPATTTIATINGTPAPSTVAVAETTACTACDAVCYDPAKGACVNGELQPRRATEAPEPSGLAPYRTMPTIRTVRSYPTYWGTCPPGYVGPDATCAWTR